jgi:hypothetical protein
MILRIGDEFNGSGFAVFRTAAGLAASLLRFDGQTGSPRGEPDIVLHGSSSIDMPLLMSICLMTVASHGVHGHIVS